MLHIADGSGSSSVIFVVFAIAKNCFAGDQNLYRKEEILLAKPLPTSIDSVHFDVTFRQQNSFFCDWCYVSTAGSAGLHRYV